jgi:WD40 repeat protein
MVATASWDNTARVWDVRTGTELQRLRHDNRVESIAFSPDGTKLATGSYDNFARIWDVKTGEEIQRLSHSYGVISVVFSPDARKLATASRSPDTTARIWMLSKENLTNEACSCLPWNMTEEEWKRFIPVNDILTCPREGLFKESPRECMSCRQIAESS